MKRMIIAVLMMAAAQIFAGNPEVKEVQRSYHTHSKLYGQGKYYQISRDDVSYLIYFQWVRATQKTEEQVLVGLPEPNFWSGFNRRGMFNLMVNGISIYELEPKSIKMFKDAGKAGIEIRYNFSGAQMDVRFFLDKALPVLHVECVPYSGNKPGKIKTLNLNFSVAPQVDGKPRNSYKRELQTPRTTYAKSGWTAIHPKDAYFIMYDAVYDYGTKNPKSQAPLYLKPDHSFLQKGRFHYGKSAPITFQLTFKPDAKKIAFDILELRKPLSKKDFVEYLKSHKVIPGGAK